MSVAYGGLHTSTNQSKLFTIRDAPAPQIDSKRDGIPDDSAKFNNDIPIVIDNGSWRTRCGFATDPIPRLVCPPLVSRYLDRKAGRKYAFGGYDTYVDATARGQAKSVFDGSVVSNFDAFEMLLDYCFIKLGLEGDPPGGLGHPLVITETVCNPSYSRKLSNELIFEAYNTPALVYGIDALFSYRLNGGRTGLVVSSGNTSTHLIPVLNGKGVTSLTTRLNWAGSQGTEIMLKLLQLKYPGFPSKLQTWQVERLVMDHCYVSGDYKEEIAVYLQKDNLEGKNRVIQFPFTETVKFEKTQEELDKIVQKRKESGRRLQEQAAKARLEKLMKKEQELSYYRDLQASSETMAKREWKRVLEANDLDNDSQLEKIIKDLDGAIKRGRKQDVGDEKDMPEEPPSFPLLNTPDEDLDEEGKKQKRQQRLMKSSYEARKRAKAEKDQEKQRQANIAMEDQRARENDLDQWVNEKRQQRNVGFVPLIYELAEKFQSLIAKINHRARLREELADRKSVASRMRMETIANLASDAPSAKKRRRGANAESDDTFGANDDDWAVYRSVGAGGTGGNEEDQEEEEDLNRELKTIEALLLAHDPNFGEDHTREAQSDWSKSIIHAFLRGCGPFDPEDQAQLNQMHINVERIRVPEIVFEPSMAGLDQAGIIEIASDILTHRISNPLEQEQLLKDIFLTGGNTSFKGFDERLKKEMISVLPTGMTINVRKARDPCLDAWYGAAQWANQTVSDAEWKRAVITKSEYLEKGSDYIKEHRLGNAFG